MLHRLDFFKGRRWGYRQVFCLCFLLAALLYLPYLIADGGLFRYAGDFNSQQINFYQYTNDFVKNGGGSFSWETDLGSGFVNSYSFYLLGSPFWWLSLLLPGRVMPYMMVPFLCLRYAFAGAGAWLWAKRYTTGEWAALAGLLYAFSGYTLYNAFFNHFLDVVALFPYLLWALDAALYDGRRGWLALLVALNLLNNYFFFAGQIVFLFIYFFCKWSAGEFKLTGKLFCTLAFESLLGCCMGCLLAWPALLSLAQNPRTVDMASGYEFLFYSKPQQYAAILSSLFLMPDAPYLSTLWSEGVIKWTSLTAYLPLASCAGVLAWLKYKPGTAFKRVLCTCLIFALVPVLNSSFYALNSSFYARWYYMPVLVMALCTAKGLEEKLPQRGSAVAVAAVLLAHLALALVPEYDAELESWHIGVLKEPLLLCLYLGVTLLGVAVYAALCRKSSAGTLARRLLAAVAAFSLLYGNVHLAVTKLNQWDADLLFDEQCYTEGPLLEEYFGSQGHFFRTDAYECYDNMSLWMKTPCIRFFNSTVAPSILEFYPEVGVTRDVNTKPDYDLYALRGLLSVEYLLMPLDKQEAWAGEEAKGWQKADEVGSYAVYRNENYLPMGFAYDHYITRAEFESVPKSGRGALLMKALLLSEEQVAKYGALLEPLPEGQKNSRSYKDYQEDCAARRASACESFTPEKNGFTAVITLDAPNLVFFSVPYDDGFTATVNGLPAEVEKVDNGLMAVCAPAGRSEIVFRYAAPGLGQSAAASAAGCAVFALYLILGRRKRRPDAPQTLPPLPHGGAALQTHFTQTEEQ